MVDGLDFAQPTVLFKSTILQNVLAFFEVSLLIGTEAEFV